MTSPSAHTHDLDLAGPEWAAVKELDETAEWLVDLPLATVKRYAGRWVAARDKRIVTSGKTYAELARKIGVEKLGRCVVRLIEEPLTVIYGHGIH